jgi:hypothetical protein
MMMYNVDRTTELHMRIPTIYILTFTYHVNVTNEDVPNSLISIIWAPISKRCVLECMVREWTPKTKVSKRLDYVLKIC